MKDGPLAGARGHSPEPWSRFAYWTTILALGASFLAYFLPSMAAGIQGQDVALDSINGYRIYHSLTPLSAVTHALAAIELQQGGWLPLKGAILAFWQLEPPPPMVRGLQAFIVTCDLLLFATLLARQWRSLPLGSAASIGALLALQFHKPHDAILDSSLTIPLSFGLILVTYLSFSSYISKRNWQTLIVAAMSLTLASTLHESGWILAIGVPILAFSASAGRASALALLLIPGACFGITILSNLPQPISLRWLAHPTLTEAERGVGQLFGALPMTYRAFDNVTRYHVVTGDTETRFWNVPALNLMGQILTFAVSLGTYAIAIILGQQHTKPLLSNRAPLSLAAIFAIAAFILQDPDVWRAGIPLGEASDATFFGCFSFGTAFAYAIMGILRALDASRAKPAFAPLLALSVGLVLYGNLRVNTMIIQIDQVRFDALRLLKQSSKAGLFRALPPKSDLALDGDFGLSASRENDLENTKYLLSSLAGRRLDVLKLGELARIARNCSSANLQNCPQDRGLWILRRVDQGPGRGGLVLAPLVAANESQILVDRAIVFQDETAFPPDVWKTADIGGRGIRVISRADNAGQIITTLARTCGAVQIDRALIPNQPNMILGAGFIPGNFFKYYQFASTSHLPTRTDGKQDWHYVTATSEVHVYPDGCDRPSTVHLEADVFAPSPSKLVVTIGSGVTRFNVSEAGTHIDLPIPFAMRQRIETIVTLRTDAPAANEELMFPPFSRDKYPSAHLLINNLDLSEQQIRG